MGFLLFLLDDGRIRIWIHTDFYICKNVHFGIFSREKKIISL